MSVKLVLGSNGKTGSRVAGRLERLGYNVRRGSRLGQPPFDWTREDSWAPVLAGAESVYVAYYPDFAVPGAIEVLQRFFAAVRREGVRRAVLLSGRGEIEAVAAEDALRETGVDWTVLRSSWFMQNFSEGLFAPLVSSGVLALPENCAPEPFVDIEDIADMAALAMTGPELRNRIVELTGPQALSFEDLAQSFTAAGVDVQYVPTSMEAFIGMLLKQGLPKDVVSLLSYLFGEVLDGRNTPVSLDTESILGRPAGSFDEFVRRSAAEGAWRLAA